MSQPAGPPSGGPRLRAALDDVPRYRPGRPPPVRAGARTYKASSNENPFTPLPGVLEAALSAAAAMNRYPDATASGLTRALAQRFSVPSDHLVAGTGSVGVLQQIVTATCGPGDEVVYAWRSFEAYPIVVRLAGAQAVEVPLRPDETHDLDAIRAAISAATRLVLLCSPNNPTGTVIAQTELDTFLDEVPPDVLVVLDEAYVEFVRDPRAANGLSSYRQRANLCLLRTFSKAYGLAGLRVGYAVAHPEVADGVRASGLPFNVSAVGQEAAVASLAREHELMQRVEAIVAERSRVRDGLLAQGWPLPGAEGNFVWLRLGDRTGDFAAACEREGLAVRGYGNDGVRVTVGEPAAGDLLLQVCASWRAARHS